MSEELNQELNQELDQEHTPDFDFTETEVQYSETELEAMEQGWNPEGVEGKRSLSAEEFLDRKPLYDKIHKSDRAIKKMQEQQAALMQHLANLRKNLTDQKVEDLKKQKRAALEDQEHDRVMEIDEEIIKTRSEELEVEQAPDTSVFDSWVENNSWYESDIKMKRYADAVGAEYAATYGKVDASILQKIAEEVKEAFPDKFMKPRKQVVEQAGRGRQPTRGSKYTAKDLDPIARKIMRTLIDDKTYESEEAYIKDLEASGYFN